MRYKDLSDPDYWRLGADGKPIKEMDAIDITPKYRAIIKVDDGDKIHLVALQMRLAYYKLIKHNNLKPAEYYPQYQQGYTNDDFIRNKWTVIIEAIKR